MNESLEVGEVAVAADPTMAAANTHPVTMVITKVALVVLTKVERTRTLKQAINTASIKINLRR